MLNFLIACVWGLECSLTLVGSCRLHCDLFSFQAEEKAKAKTTKVSLLYIHFFHLTENAHMRLNQLIWKSNWFLNSSKIYVRNMIKRSCVNSKWVVGNSYPENIMVTGLSSWILMLGTFFSSWYPFGNCLITEVVWVFFTVYILNFAPSPNTKRSPFFFPSIVLNSTLRVVIRRKWIVLIHCVLNFIPSG